MFCSSADTAEAGWELQWELQWWLGAEVKLVLWRWCWSARRRWLRLLAGSQAQPAVRPASTAPRRTTFLPSRSPSWREEEEGRRCR